MRIDLKERDNKKTRQSRIRKKRERLTLWPPPPDITADIREIDCPLLWRGWDPMH